VLARVLVVTTAILAAGWDHVACFPTISFRGATVAAVAIAVWVFPHDLCARLPGTPLSDFSV